MSEGTYRVCTVSSGVTPRVETLWQDGHRGGITPAILLRRDHNNEAGEWNEPASYPSVRRQQQLLVMQRAKARHI